MFKRPTVFILGAGASEEVKMPVGRGLADAIAKQMEVFYSQGGDLVGKGDKGLVREIGAAIGLVEAVAAAKRLREGLPLVKSIDDFLDQNSADQALIRVAKAAIAKSVLNAEGGSQLAYFDDQRQPHLNVANIANTWFVKLMRMLRNSDPNHVLDNLSFIVFNYDRCLEFFLLSSLADRYDLSGEEAASIIRGVPIFHPYGRVANLARLYPDGVPYGWTAGEMKPLTNNIRTYTEEISEEARLSEMHKTLEKADNVVFLGFAFHEQNMNLLRPKAPLATKNVLGTVKDISGSNLPIVRKRLASIFAPDAGNNLVKLHGMTCAQLFDEYELGLPVMSL